MTVVQTCALPICFPVTILMAWINAATAKKLGIKSGDTIEIATFRQKSGYGAKEDEIVGRLKIKAFVSEGIHPSVVAVSASLGMGYGGRIAKAKNGKKQNINGFSDLDDPDFQYCYLCPNCGNLGNFDFG